MLVPMPLLCAGCSTNMTGYGRGTIAIMPVQLCTDTNFSSINTYIQICYSKRGQSFKSPTVSMQIEILHSPYLYELVAFHINVREANTATATATAALQLEGRSLVFDYGRPSPSLLLLDSAKLNIELTCSICLVSTINHTYIYVMLIILTIYLLIRKRYLIRCLLGVVICSATCARVKPARSAQWTASRQQPQIKHVQYAER